MTQPAWIEVEDVLRVHECLLALDGGMTGLRDGALLESALARPQQLHAYSENPDIIDMAAAYTAGLLQNHVFFDGNKRTGFVVGILFLELNGYRFTAAEDTATQTVLGLAAGILDEAGYAEFLRANTTAGF